MAAALLQLFCPLLAQVAAAAEATAAAASQPGGKGSRFAYASLASGSHVLLPVRVLGHSIDRAGGAFQKVLMLTYTPSDSERELMTSEGWILQSFDRLASPYDDKGEMTRNTFSTLLAFALEDFDRVMFFDADMVVLRNVDNLFGCGEFCAATTERETKGRFNTGIHLLSPSKQMFDDLLGKARSGKYPSYNRGIQGFLNLAMSEWCSGGKAQEWAKIFKIAENNRPHQCKNLEPGVNQIASLHTRSTPGWWPPSAINHTSLWGTSTSVLHFNHPVFWAVKPWIWYWYPVILTNWVWWQARWEVPGDGWRAARLGLMSLATSALTSLSFIRDGDRWPVWAMPARQRISAVLWRLLRRLRLADVGAAGTTCACLCRTHFARTVFLSAVGSVGIFLLLPPQANALAAWSSYHVLKGCILGVGIYFLGRQPGEQTSVGDRLRFVLAGYCCGLLEVLVVWSPQQFLGFEFISERLLYPVCTQAGDRGSIPLWLYETLDCTNTLWCLFAALGVPGLVAQAYILHLPARNIATKTGHSTTTSVQSKDMEA